MDRPRFFENAAFREYVELLGELHRLIRDGRDESPEGDALRDRMDAPGELLDSDEVAEAGEIAADFYQFSEPKVPAPHVTDGKSPGIPPAAIIAWQGGDLLKALRVCREYGPDGEPLVLASVRGCIWAQLGFPSIASCYLQNGMEILDTGAARPARNGHFQTQLLETALV